jgi:hypothetical protein
MGDRWQAVRFLEPVSQARTVFVEHRLVYFSEDIEYYLRNVEIMRVAVEGNRSVGWLGIIS